MNHHQSAELGGGRGGRTKKNQLNTGPPPRIANASTFDWEGQRDRYWRTLDWQAVVMQSQNRDAAIHRLKLEGKAREAQELAEQKYKKTAKTRGVENPGIGKGRRYDREEIVRLYEDGKTVKQIQQMMDIKTDRTVREALRAAGVFDPNRDRGPKVSGTSFTPETAPRRQPREVCWSGLHNMSVYGRPVRRRGPDGESVENGRYCSACKAIKDSRDKRGPEDFETVEGV